MDAPPHPSDTGSRNRRDNGQTQQAQDDLLVHAQCLDATERVNDRRVRRNLDGVQTHQDRRDRNGGELHHNQHDYDGVQMHRSRRNMMQTVHDRHDTAQRLHDQRDTTQRASEQCNADGPYEVPHDEPQVYRASDRRVGKPLVGPGPGSSVDLKEPNDIFGPQAYLSTPPRHTQKYQVVEQNPRRLVQEDRPRMHPSESTFHLGQDVLRDAEGAVYEGGRPLNRPTRVPGGGFYHFHLRSQSPQHGDQTPQWPANLNIRQPSFHAHNPVRSPYYHSGSKSQGNYVRAGSMPPTPTRRIPHGVVPELHQPSVEQPPRRAQSINDELLLALESTSQRSESRPPDVISLSSDSASSSEWEIDPDDFPDTTLRPVNIRNPITDHDHDTHTEADATPRNANVGLALVAQPVSHPSQPAGTTIDAARHARHDTSLPDLGDEPCPALQHPMGDAENAVPVDLTVASGVDSNDYDSYNDLDPEIDPVETAADDEPEDETRSARSRNADEDSEGSDEEESDEDVDDEDDESSGVVSKSRKGRRLSKRIIADIKERLHVVEEEMENIASDTGATIAQVYNIWKATDKRTRDVDSWQLYQAYYVAFQAKEDARVSHRSTAAMTRREKSAHIAECYRKFKEAYPKTYREALLIFDDCRKLDKPQTVGQRSGHFNKYCNQIEDLVNRNHKIYGFNTLVLFGGSLVNQDSNVGGIIESSGASMYFEEMWNIPNKYVESNFQAHCIHGTAQRDSRSKGAAIAARLLVPQHDDVVKAEQQPEAEVIKKKKRDKGDVRTLRELFVSVLEPLGCSVLDKPKDPDSNKEGTFPWKQLPEKLAAAGIRLENWPYGVGYPENGDGKCSKGIAELHKVHREMLEDALNDRDAPYSIRAIKDEKIAEDYHRSSYAIVIMGAPPPAHAEHARGLRLRVKRGGPRRSSDIKPDWMGLPRCLPRESSPTQMNDEPPNNVDVEPRRQSDRLKEKDAQKQTEVPHDSDVSGSEYAPTVIPGSVPDELEDAPALGNHDANKFALKKGRKTAKTMKTKTRRKPKSREIVEAEDDELEDHDGGAPAGEDNLVSRSTSMQAQAQAIDTVVQVDIGITKNNPSRHQPENIDKGKRKAEDEHQPEEAMKKQRVSELADMPGGGLSVIHEGQSGFVGASSTMHGEQSTVTFDIGAPVIHAGQNSMFDAGSSMVHGGQNSNLNMPVRVPNNTMGGLNTIQGLGGQNPSGGNMTQGGPNTMGVGQVMMRRGQNMTNEGMPVTTGGLLNMQDNVPVRIAQGNGGQPWAAGGGPGPASHGGYASGYSGYPGPVPRDGQQLANGGHSGGTQAQGHGRNIAAAQASIFNALANSDMPHEMRQILQLCLVQAYNNGPSSNLYPAGYGSSGGAYANGNVGPPQEQGMNSGVNANGPGAPGGMPSEGTREMTYGGQGPSGDVAQRWQ